MRLFLYTLSHACVDAISAVTVLQYSKYFSPDLLFGFIIGYDLLAFATQPFVGWTIDKYANKKILVLFAFILLIVGFIAPVFQWIRIIFVGLGNSLFHVAAGAEVLKNAHNKMWPLGVFVSTGTIGLTIGTQYSSDFYVQGFFIGVLILLFCAIVLSDKTNVSLKTETNISVKIPIWIPISLLFCISIRSFMGFAKPVPFENIAFLPVIISLFVFTGKFIGGFLCDKFSITRIILISVTLAGVFYLFSSTHYIVWGLAQLTVNISMPITLYLLYRYMPNRPGFGFGLAAAFLLPGMFISLLRLPISDIIYGIILILNLILILAANKAIIFYQNNNIPVNQDKKLAISKSKNNLPLHL